MILRRFLCLAALVALACSSSATLPEVHDIVDRVCACESADCAKGAAARFFEYADDHDVLVTPAAADVLSAEAERLTGCALRAGVDRAFLASKAAALGG